jgi:hypothetical protein
MGRLASWRILAASGLLFAAFASVFFASSAPFAIPHVEEVCGAPPLDVRFSTSADDVNDFLADCGQQGREAYRNLQIADLFYPAVSGLFMASALALTLKHLFPQRSGVVALASVALAGSALDYLENVFAWIALTTYPDPAMTNFLLGIASAGKTSAFWTAGVGLVVALAALAIKAVRQHAVDPAQHLG